MHRLTELPAPLVALLPRLTARARRLSDSASDAEDLLQDTVLTLWKVLGRGDKVAELDRYAMTIMRNLARQRWRNRRPTDPLEDEMAQIGPDAPLRLACAELQAAIARLPEDQRALMQLVAAGETSPAALASLTGLRVGTVMSRLARARAQLRSVLGLGKSGSVLELF